MADKVLYSDEKLQALIESIYAGEISEYDLPTDLYIAISDYLKSALYKGFGGTLVDFEGADLELLTELRTNIYQFSAAKSFQMVKDISNLMFTEEGGLKSIDEFSKDAVNTYDTWTDAYGRTEYNTAKAQATMASKWNEIERNKEILPYLQYVTLGDACSICLPLDGLIAPVNDSVWDAIYPSNHFNCECTVLQLEPDVKATNDDEKEAIFNDVTEKMDDNFKMNSGKDGYVFSDKHPYFDVEKKDVDFKNDNFGLTIPKED
jgi:Phage Mu protein F like protein